MNNDKKLKYNVEERQFEKIQSRIEDQYLIDNGILSRAEINQKNGLSWRGGKIDWEKSELY